MTDNLTDSVDNLTAAEFAELAGVSRQAVYRRINSPELAPFIRLENGSKLINTAALPLFSAPKRSKHTQTDMPETDGCQLDKRTCQLDSELTDEVDRLTTLTVKLTTEVDNLTSLADNLTAEVDRLQAENRELVEVVRTQREELSALREQHETVLRLTDQAQQLTAAALRAQQSLLESPRRSFWRRFFRRA